MPLLLLLLLLQHQPLRLPSQPVWQASSPRPAACCLPHAAPCAMADGLFCSKLKLLARSCCTLHTSFVFPPSRPRTALHLGSCQTQHTKVIRLGERYCQR